MALGLENVRVGTWTSPTVPTGCTVILPPPGTLGAVAVRGQSPGIRFAVSLGPTGKLTVCHGVVLTGASVFGQAAADGVTTWLEEQGVGYPVGSSVVPIVGAAHLLDRSVHQREGRPTADSGYAACVAASQVDPPDGAFGAGAGCSIAKVGGLEAAWRGGQGVAIRRHGDLVVGAIVANNAVGELRDDHGKWLLRARMPDDAPRYPFVDVFAREGNDGIEEDNTVIGCVVTNARLDKVSAHRVADLAHSGVDRAVRPSHTYFDGDAMFALATGEVEAHIDLVATLAAEAVAEACRRGPLAATSLVDLPGAAEV
ncbi:MAG: L-aminopeptidase/D-esterase-like protein [Glaciecola sp.]|jgi:L-aminopeptidase/D-esterase-like protein